MTHSPKPELHLAVDAGGTKTAAWLAESREHEPAVVLGRGRSSSGNPLSAGFDLATRAITEAVQQARREANQPAAPVARAVLSIAGSADRDTSNKLIDWAHHINLAERIAIVSDFLPVLAAGTPNCCGIALIAGTGSVAFARAADGRTTRCGGWGYLLGDDGSGYAIGRSAIRFALEDLETTTASPSGRGSDGHRRAALVASGEGTRLSSGEGSAPLKPLSCAVLDHFRAASVAELTRKIHGNPSPRAVIAEVAPLVTHAAETGDASAHAILDTAAHDLARLVARATVGQAFSLTSLQSASQDPIPLAIAGGLLVASKRLQEQLARELHNAGVGCNLTVVDEPLVGCLRLASPELSCLDVTWHQTV